MVPMLVLPQIILIDTMGFGILTPLLASALARESESAICRGFSEGHRYLIYGFTAGLYPMMFFWRPDFRVALGSRGPNDDPPGLRGRYRPGLRDN